MINTIYFEFIFHIFRTRARGRHRHDRRVRGLGQNRKPTKPRKRRNLQTGIRNH